MNCPLCKNILKKSTWAFECHSLEHQYIIFKFVEEDSAKSPYVDKVTLYDRKTNLGVWITLSNEYIYRLNNALPVTFYKSKDINIERVTQQFLKLKKLQAFL